MSTAGSTRIRATVVAGVIAALGLTGALVPPAAAAPGTTAPSASPAPVATATPRPAPTATPVGPSLAIDLAPGAVLTLPAKDGLRDRAVFRVLSGAGGRIDVDAVRGRKTVHLRSRLALRRTASGWGRTVPVAVSGLTAGAWRIRVQRSADPAVRARSRATVTVGSGTPVHVLARPADRTLYPYRDGVLDTAVVAVTATDETGEAVPVAGTIRIDSGARHATRTLTAAGTARVPVTALPLGTAKMTTSVTGPAGRAVRRTALTLAPTGVGASRIARSSDTVQPVVDGLLDSVVLTTTGSASAGSSAKVSGTLTVSRGRTVAAVFDVPDGRQRAFVWDGRVAGAVVPGTYLVTSTLRGPQGAPRTSTTTVLVSNQHLPYRVQDLFTVAAGNQQGLAVRNDIFSVGYDLGGDQARIDLYSGLGVRVGSLGPLPIGHVAELSYSTTTGLLYAANGGNTTPTKIWAIDPLDPQWTANPQTDPAAAVRATFDLSALGTNGMVVVDDANARLLVFSGSSGAYRVTAVSIADVTTTDDAGVVTTVAAGTPGTSVPIAITGIPQGIELVGQQLWVYTSLKKKNHIARYDLAGNPVLGADGSGDLMWGGEGEGLAALAAADTNDGLPGWFYVGAHGSAAGDPNRVGRLVPVPDE